MKITRTENLSLAVISEAVGGRDGLMAMNAGGSRYYGFCVGDNRLVCGVYLGAGEEKELGALDGYVDFETGVVVDVGSGERRNYRCQIE